MNIISQYWPDIISGIISLVVAILYIIFRYGIKKTKEVILNAAKDSLEKVDVKNNKVREEIDDVKAENEKLRRDVDRLYKALSRFAGEEVEDNGQLYDNERN